MQLLQRVVHVSKKGEPGEIRRLKERVKQLESALADVVMDQALDRAFFKILCEQQMINPEEFKKKHATKVSRRPGKKEEKSEE